MKYFPILLPLFVCMYFFSTLSCNAGESDTVTLESITYNPVSNNKETVVFKLDDTIKVKIFQLYGDNPRIVIDFPNGIYRGKNVIPVESGIFASAIRIGAHTEPIRKTRVVIDLTKKNKIRYEKFFSEEDKTLTVTLLGEERQTVGPLPAVVKKKVKKSERPVPPVFADKPVLPDRKVRPSMPSDDKTNKNLNATEKPSVAAISGSNSGTAPEIGKDIGESKARLLEISFDDSSNKGEMVIFRLNDFYPPSVSAVEKETPRVICDFMDMELGPDVNRTISAKGKYVEKITTSDPAAGTDRIQVVLDLAPDRDYDLQQVFFKNDNLFVLIVNELPAEVVVDGGTNKEKAAME
ncbi:AMIN domain-containing protein [Desulfomarina sp.]